MNFSVAIEEIYPFEKINNSKKYKEAGTCHAIVNLGDMTIEIKNIYYSITHNNKVFVGMPGKSYDDPRSPLKQVFVPSITFSDKEIVNTLLKEARKEIQSLL